MNNSPKTSDKLLAMLGITCLAVYVLACRPSFNPEGTKIVFPFFDDNAAQSCVALYDRETGEMENILMLPADGDSMRIFSAQWAADGKRVVVVGEGWVMILPLGSKNPTRLFSVKDADMKEEYSLFPAPIVGRRLFLSGKTVVRLDLESGQTKTLAVDEETWLLGFGSRIFYLVERPTDQKVFEIGQLDPETLKQSPVLEFKEADYGDLVYFAAMPADASRIALVAEKEDAQKILLFRDKEFEKAISIGTKADPIKVLNIEWSRDGKTIYAAYCKKQGQTNDLQCGLLEAPLDGGRPREIPLLLEAKEDEMAFFQFALSPDGKTIAATLANMKEKIKPEHRALYLIDLSSAERKVTRIPVPLTPAAKPAVDGQ